MRYNQDRINQLGKQLADYGVRSSVFLDPEIEQVELVSKTAVDRIELYTEEYASAFGTDNQQKVWQKYADAANLAQELGLGVNAGHDLDSQNLGKFLEIPKILEVSIGHVLTIECLLEGMPTVIKRYLDICKGSN